jgi:endonuclease/exonuclease/phosphatase family metal-dependent hydrolase
MLDKFIIRFLLVYLYLGCAPIFLVHAQKEAENEKGGITLKIMTYNLKFASPTFEPSWEIRREWQVEMIKKYDPDIIGTQEGLKEQIDYLMDHLPEYIVVGEGRKGGDDDEHMALFLKRNKFRLRELQSFQLSETPDVIGSGPEVNPRMVTWARVAMINRPVEGEDGPYPQDFRGHWDNTREIYVFNTHFFNGKNQKLARLNAAKLIMERTGHLARFGEWINDRPIFLVGDFNCRPGSAPYEILVGGDKFPQETLFKDSSNEHSEIDWILYRGPVEVVKYEVVDYNVKGIYPSDHKPILVEFKLLE